MPADLTVRNGRAEIFYTGEKPWHGHGQRVDNPATAEEALEAAGIDWKVTMEPVYIQRTGSDYAEVPDKAAIVREDTRDVFNIMSRRYSPVQNREAFAFFDGVVGAGEAIYHTAGSIGGGRRVWILAKLPADLKVSNGDVLERYILLANSHDGSTALTMKPTTVRVVCSNTLQVALGDEGRKSFKTSHVGDVFKRVNEAREVLDLGEAYFAMLMRGVERLAEDAAPAGPARYDFFRELFELDQKEAMSARARNNVVAIESFFTYGKGNSGETRWDLLNGVTEWVDHARGQDKGRLDSAWFGSGAQLKQRAWDLLTV